MSVCCGRLTACGSCFAGAVLHSVAQVRSFEYARRFRAPSLLPAPLHEGIAFKTSLSIALRAGSLTTRALVWPPSVSQSLLHYCFGFLIEMCPGYTGPCVGRKRFAEESVAEKESWGTVLEHPVGSVVFESRPSPSMPCSVALSTNFSS